MLLSFDVVMPLKICLTSFFLRACKAVILQSGLNQRQKLLEVSDLAMFRAISHQGLEFSWGNHEIIKKCQSCVVLFWRGVYNVGGQRYSYCLSNEYSCWISFWSGLHGFCSNFWVLSLDLFWFWEVGCYGQHSCSLCWMWRSPQWFGKGFREEKKVLTQPERTSAALRTKTLCVCKSKYAF